MARCGRPRLGPMGRRSARSKARKGRGPEARLRPKAAARLAERFRLASLDHRAGRLAPAEAGYREVLSAAPEFPGAALNYALLARSTGRLGLALELAERAVASQPKEAAPHATLGNLLLERERTRDAVVAYRTALALDPGHVNARFNLGGALRRSGEPEAAASEFRRLVERFPDDPDFRIALGGALLDSGRPREAMEAHERALALSPDHPDALTELGLAHVDTGEFETAGRCYRRVIDGRPDHPSVWLNYSKTRRFGPADTREIEEAEAVAARLDARPDPGPRVRRRAFRPRQDIRRPRRVRPRVRAPPARKRDPQAPCPVRPPWPGAPGGGHRGRVRGSVVRPDAGRGGSVSTAHLHRGDAALGHDPGRADSRVPPRGARRGRAHSHPQPRAEPSRCGGLRASRGRRRPRSGGSRSGGAGLPRLRRCAGRRRGEDDGQAPGELSPSRAHRRDASQRPHRARRPRPDGRLRLELPGPVPVGARLVVRFRLPRVRVPGLRTPDASLEGGASVPRARAVLRVAGGVPGIGEPPAGRVLRARMGRALPRLPSHRALRAYRERLAGAPADLPAVRRALAELRAPPRAASRSPRGGGSGGRGGRDGDGAGGSAP